MRSSGPKRLFLSSKMVLASFLLFFSMTPKSWAADSEQGMPDLTEIKARLESLEKGQQNILDQEAKILEELDRIRIWVHHR